MRPAIIDSASGSLMIRRSGGWSSPVSQGETSRMIMPDGAIRKASPKAAAACGTDSSGEIIRRILANPVVPRSLATKAATAPSETSVVISPIATDSTEERQMPGTCASSLKWAVVK